MNLDLAGIMKVIVTANYFVSLGYSPKEAFTRSVFFSRNEYPLTKEDVVEAKERYEYDFHLEDSDWNYMMGW